MFEYKKQFLNVLQFVQVTSLSQEKIVFSKEKI